MTAPVKNPYVGFRKDARGVKTLWERFNAGLVRRDELRDRYHHMLVGEWERCTALGVDVAMNRGRRLSDVEFAQRRADERVLLDRSLPVIDDVGRYLRDVPGIMILTESTGCILHISGEQRIRELAAETSGIIDGSMWGEGVAGSNGIGTALSKRHPVHVFSSEHFCEGWHGWSCAAAPIFEPDGQTLLGVIDFTTVDDDYRDQTLGLTVSLANSIQAQISLHRELERRVLLAAFGDCARRYPNDDIVALDHAGRAVMQTPSDRCAALVARMSPHGGGAALPAREVIDIAAPDGVQHIGSIAILGDTTRQASTQPAHVAQPLAGNAATDATGLNDGADIVRFGDFVTSDPATRRMIADVQRVAPADVNILIFGETGTGKELLARHIHASSPRRLLPYIAVNCGAISEALLESTLFGYVRGAFSGADPRGRAGYFESARGGTLFLDEIGELPRPMQAALLRVLEDGSFQRIGSCETQHATCRIIAATNRRLEEEVASGRFRRDLYYRLKIVRHEIRPLRARACDIPLLTRQFVASLARKHGRTAPRVSAEAQSILNAWHWPGNARELRNVLESAVLCADDLITPDCLPNDVLPARGGQASTARGDGPGEAPMAAPDHAASGRVAGSTAEPVSTGRLESVLECERRIIISTLCACRKVSAAAKQLGMARSTLYKKFERLGIDQNQYL
jgi:sigma-54 dependent transcriptional regulator, acetoin dehydrogenase operon transcriptional activator AcoR